MTSSRRTFLKTGAIAVTAVTLIPEVLLAAPMKKQRLGIQLYSVRDEMKNDPSGTLKQLAGMGYKNVEHADYVDRKFYGYSAPEFKKLLMGMGLFMPSGHTVMTARDYDNAKGDFTDKWKYTIDDAVTVGQLYVISPWLDESLRADMDGLKRFMEQFNKCGELCKAHGMKFGYHNHDFEFKTKIGDGNLYDFILANTDKSLVAQQLDIGNNYGIAGSNPLEIIKKHPGRFELMHVKDEIKAGPTAGMGNGYESAILGEGLIPVKEVVDLALKIGGTSQFIIEQESYQDKTPIACVKIDLHKMEDWGFKA